MSDPRTLACHAMLEAAGWGEAVRKPLAGDASNRRYERLHKGPQTAVLMDAPPAKGEDVRPFVTIAQHLSAIGLSAPTILAEQPEQGFLLIEDLGDDLFARVLNQDAHLEPTLYTAATDALIALHAAPMPAHLAPYDAPTMGPLAALACVWYAPDPKGEAAISAEVSRLVAATELGNHVLVQRDYHAENLLWLPERKGVARVGLLDFQDAMAGANAYDLVSLLQDARRDVGADIPAQMMAHYCDQTGTDPDAFAAAYAVCGAQRNLRILGVFARLWLRDGKAQYLPLIPRVWDHIQTNLAHPMLADLAQIVADHCPVPTPEVLAAIKARRP